MIVERSMDLQSIKDKLNKIRTELASCVKHIYYYIVSYYGECSTLQTNNLCYMTFRSYRQLIIKINKRKAIFYLYMYYYYE